MKAVNSRIQWSGRSWRLRVDSLPRPDGSLEEKGYVEHPGAVVLVPLQGDQVIMLRQYRAAVGETILELPAGTRGWDEDWLACAQRELREETGYRADRFVSLGQVWPAPGFSSERMAIFLATGL
ncbi:MAG: NUDIX hydrolase, partial [Anaerolineales bacterium]|nr:NUDIX hydrolase [Anaerolineales bacterium]